MSLYTYIFICIYRERDSAGAPQFSYANITYMYTNITKLRGTSTVRAQISQFHVSSFLFPVLGPSIGNPDVKYKTFLSLPGFDVWALKIRATDSQSLLGTWVSKNSYHSTHYSSGQTPCNSLCIAKSLSTISLQISEAALSKKKKTGHQKQ